MNSSHGESDVSVHGFAGVCTGGTDLRRHFITLDTAAAAAERWPRVWGGEDKSCSRPEALTSHARLCEAFFSAVRRAADRTALVTRRARICYAQLGQWSLGVAHDLARDPIYQPGDRVALMLDNGPEFIAAYFGVLAAGGVVVPLPSNIEWSRLERIAAICGVKRIVSNRLLVTRRPELSADDCRPIDLETGGRQWLPQVPPLVIDGQSLAMIMFTSGSSGEPKGVMLSDANILANTQSILDYLPIKDDDRALALLPFYHAFGHSILQTHLLAGATLVCDGNMTFPNSIIDALERHEATSFSAVPEGYYSLLTFSELGQRSLPHLRYMSVAGGALKPDAVVNVAQRISPAEFYVMYGQTEATARLAYLPAAQARVRPGSIGRAIPHVDLRVLDEDGHQAGIGETGELCARGANVMLGYWNDERATSEAIRDGWLRTGDLATCDGDGYFYVRARKNDLVKLQGFRVHPREVEDAVARHFPALRIIVVPYLDRGVTRLALYAITSDSEADLADRIRCICMRRLPRHKVPQHIEVLPRAPLNASMKLDRTALARRAESHAATPLKNDSGGGSCGKLSA